MSANSTLTRDALPATLCARCLRHRVLITVDRHGSRKVLDELRVPGGLYDLDERGRAVRRPIARVVAEAADARAGRLNTTRGYAVHECPTARPRRSH